MRYPEGLHLSTTPEMDTLAIFDADGVMWVTFNDGGTGDPARWPKSIVLDTCKALDIDSAINDDTGEVVTPNNLVDYFYGELDFLN